MMPSGGQPDQELTPERGETGDSVSLVKPLFVKVRDLPQSPVDYKTYELCRSCERVSGPQSMEGAQRIGGLWRLYPGNSQARLTLLLSGIELRGVHVALSDVNPFLLGANGQEVDTTRLTVSDIPLSYSNKDIEDTLKRLGCILLSNLKYEHERDEKGKLTRWKTGRRFVYIETPAVPLQRDVKIGIFSAKLYHKEQRNQVLVCYNCFEKGHLSRDCTNTMKCRACRQEGHKQGDRLCMFNLAGPSAATAFPALTAAVALEAQGEADMPTDNAPSVVPPPRSPSPSAEVTPAEVIEDNQEDQEDNSLPSDSNPSEASSGDTPHESSPVQLELGDSPPEGSRGQLEGVGQHDDSDGYGPKASPGTSTPDNKSSKKKKDKRSQRILTTMFGNKRALSPEEGMNRKSKREKDDISS